MSYANYVHIIYIKDYSQIIFVEKIKICGEVYGFTYTQAVDLTFSGMGWEI